MKSRYFSIFIPALTLPFLNGCKSGSIESETLRPADNANQNLQIQDDNEKYLDMPLRISGKTLEPDERGLAIRMLSLNERDLIRGLVQWLRLLDGKYPSSLEPKIVIKQANQLLAAKYGSSERAKEQGYDIFFASTFYNKLICENKDVVYYGEEVTTKDNDKILIRWKIDSDTYRVVFGDLSTEDVSIVTLAKLEK